MQRDLEKSTLSVTVSIHLNVNSLLDAVEVLEIMAVSQFQERKEWTLVFLCSTGLP